VKSRLAASRSPELDEPEKVKIEGKKSLTDNHLNDKRGRRPHAA
jgi:hypothetical protein